MSQLGDGWEGTRTAFLLCEELEQRILQYSWLWHSRVLLLGNRKYDQPSDILLFSPVLLHLSTNAPGDSEPAWPQGLLRIWGACKGCVCVWSTSWQHHSGSQARIDLFQLTEMRGKDQNMLSPLTRGCCISHHSPCAQQSCLVYSFWLPPTRYNGTENCLVSLKLIFSTKLVLPFFFASPFLGKISITRASPSYAGKSCSQLLDSYSSTFSLHSSLSSWYSLLCLVRYFLIFLGFLINKMKTGHQNWIHSISSTLYQDNMFMCMCISVYPSSSSKYLLFIPSSSTGILPPNPLRISY